MPWSLKRFQQTRQLHFITFSCYRRQPRLNTPESRRVFERQLEMSRRRFDVCIYGYVVMPEHRGPQHARFWRDGVAMSICW